MGESTLHQSDENAAVDILNVWPDWEGEAQQAAQQYQDAAAGSSVMIEHIRKRLQGERKRIDDLVNALYEVWRSRVSLWRSDMGVWHIQLGHQRDPNSQVVDAHTLTDAIVKASHLKPLPLITRRPSVIHASDFEVRKDGSKWCLWRRGESSPLQGNFPTKKKALALADLMEQKTREAAQEWDREFGEQVAAGVEGLDFYWRG